MNTDTTGKVIFCSIGENCLVQGLLDRKKLRASIGPFTWVRSNIDYVISILEEDFSDFLNPLFLQFRERHGTKILTNSKYSCSSNQFEKSVANEFEFTHHNVLESDDEIDNYNRKINRFRSLILSDEAVVFLYHHRYTNGTEKNVSFVMRRLNEFKKFIQAQRNSPVTVLCFTQEIVTDTVDRRVEMRDFDGCRLAILHTMAVWGGSDQNLFWGKPDDDLFDKMLANYNL